MARHPKARPPLAVFSAGLESCARTVLAFYEEGMGLLVPVVVLLLALGVVLSLLATAGPLVPFIYPLF